MSASGVIYSGGFAGSKRSQMIAEIAARAQADPHASVLILSPNEDQARFMQELMVQRAGFFSVGNLSLAPNGAQVSFEFQGLERPDD